MDQVFILMNAPFASAKLQNETDFGVNAMYSMNCLTKHSGHVHSYLSLCVCVSIGNCIYICNSLV